LCLGLVCEKKARGGRWVYERFSASGQIMTLEEVAVENREPNFFEVLQAGLLHGSLAASTAGGGIYDSVSLDKNPMRQVLTIGLCLIDQWDADDDPTVVNLGGDANTLADVDVAGVENLPYLELIGQAHVTRRAPESSEALWPKISAYYQPRLWNPHRNAAQSGGGQFRIVLVGAPYVLCNWWPNRYPNNPAFTETGDPRYSDETNNRIVFTYPLPNATDGYCASAVQLMGNMVDKAETSEDNMLPTGSASPTFAGIHLGDVTLGEDNASRKTTYPGGYVEATGHIYFDQPSTVKLQKKVGNDWVTYQTIPRIEKHHGNVPWRYGPYDNNVYNGIPTLRITYAHADPRTQRFGWTTVGENISSLTVGKFIWDAGESRGWFNNWVGGGNLVGAAGKIYGLAVNTVGTSLYANNNDGLVRPADGVVGSHAYSTALARPIVLNRPFHSVGEMGYAFRDEPWKSLDFVSATSADLALLDLFSVRTEAEETAAVINPAAASVTVIEALLDGVTVDPITGETLGGADVTALAGQIADALKLRGRPVTPGDLVQTLEAIQRGRPGPFPQKEAIARALSGITNTRTWNLTVDLIAQSGRYPPGAQTVQDFLVEGERRYWIHLAIDRVTGQVLESQWERVRE
jgi:hypothetical protein